MRNDEKFRIQERIVDFDSGDDVTKRRNDEIFLKINNESQNEGEPRQEKISEPSIEKMS